VHVFRPEHDLSFTGISRSGAAAQRIDNHDIWIIFLCDLRGLRESSSSLSAAPPREDLDDAPV
jgi:hypothetical protein